MHPPNSNRLVAVFIDAWAPPDAHGNKRRTKGYWRAHISSPDGTTAPHPAGIFCTSYTQCIQDINSLTLPEIVGNLTGGSAGGKGL